MLYNPYRVYLTWAKKPNMYSDTRWVNLLEHLIISSIWFWFMEPKYAFTACLMYFALVMGLMPLKHTTVKSFNDLFRAILIANTIMLIAFYIKIW